MPMTLSPTFQFHPPTLFHSLTRLHPRRLHLPRSKPTKPLSSYSNPTPDPQTPPPPAAWIHGWPSGPPSKPLTRRPQSLLDYRSAVSDDDEEAVGTSRSTGSSTMERIVEKLKKFGYIDDSGERRERSTVREKGSVEDIFYAEDGILPDTRGGLTVDVAEEARFPWEKARLEVEGGSVRKKTSKSSVAELTLPEGELRRLRHLAIRTKSKMRIKGAGVTKEVVDLVHEKWKTEEVVRLKCEGLSALNMRRMHEILEV